ncbi:unnamed protein product [Phytophthora fragariaefolia]|uniref:Unnamed protein product n=1 Tax=Phytophthora fragariaefolia TaxID=1490495 RepID=A0A9W6U754_9STRA|nr:unnamed protein product [Phytophthora fragariaefolia]
MERGDKRGLDDAGRPRKGIDYVLGEAGVIAEYMKSVKGVDRSELESQGELDKDRTVGVRVALGNTTATAGDRVVHVGGATGSVGGVTNARAVRGDAGGGGRGGGRGRGRGVRGRGGRHGGEAICGEGRERGCGCGRGRGRGCGRGRGRGRGRRGGRGRGRGRGRSLGQALERALPSNGSGVCARAETSVAFTGQGLRRNQPSARKEATIQSDDESSSGNESGGNNGSEDEWNMDSASDTCDDDDQSSDSAVDVSTSVIEPPPNLPVTVNGNVASDDQTLSQLYSNTLVAFSPAREKWMAKKKYKGVGTAYIIGRVCRCIKKSKKAPLLFHIRWLDSQFQSYGENVSVDVVQKGHYNYNIRHREPAQVGWRSLCEQTEVNDIVMDGGLDDLVEEYVSYKPPEFFPTNLREVEIINNMRFEPSEQLEEPADLFKRTDGSTATVVREQYRHLFEHSASSSFFANPFNLQELMTFLGILFYMEVKVKGEYANYSGRQPEDGIFDVTSPTEARNLATELSEVATIRHHVLEVVRPIFNTQSIVNTDNFYTSVQLLQALRVKGLRRRGTVRSNSKHFPHHVMLHSKKSNRGDYRQGVSVEHQMLAAAWCDGNIVRVVSNADSSSMTTVRRRIGAESVKFAAPACMKQYNSYMQGVDRLDQTRARFSISDGHSFQKWHKKLAMAVIDIARCNAHLTRKLVMPSSSNRDPHREFMLDLINELISTRWIAAPSNGCMLYSGTTPTADERPSPSPVSTAFAAASPAESPKKVCTAVSSKQMFQVANRKRRQCIICRWEDRYATEVTDFCIIHAVCLCKEFHHPKDGEITPSYVCSHTTWTCWENFDVTDTSNLAANVAKFIVNSTDTSAPTASRTPSRATTSPRTTTTCIEDYLCVCNATECDTVSNDYTSLPSGQVGVYTTSKDGNRFAYKVVNVDSTAVSSPTYSIDVNHAYVCRSKYSILTSSQLGHLPPSTAPIVHKI